MQDKNTYDDDDDSLKYINSLPRNHFFKLCNFCKEEFEYINSLFIIRIFDGYFIGRVCSTECVNCYILTYTPKD